MESEDSVPGGAGRCGACFAEHQEYPPQAQPLLAALVFSAGSSILFRLLVGLGRLRVPPTIQTAAEAIAWSFGLPGEEYHPAQET
ncbi:MAG TPA: hypothetical protein VKT82_01795 [Ktedonobacterales bacterium]|nr:hypothetical protein [Ktedonobacterales bacterium]